MNSEYELILKRMAEVKQECEQLEKKIKDTQKAYRKAYQFLKDHRHRIKDLERALLSATKKEPTQDDIKRAITLFCDVYCLQFNHILSNADNKEHRFSKLRYCFLYAIDLYFDRRLSIKAICKIIEKDSRMVYFAKNDVRAGLKDRGVWPIETRDYLDKLRVFLDTHVKGNEWQR